MDPSGHGAPDPARYDAASGGTMRRALLALMTAIPLSLSLTACGDKSDEDEDEDDGGSDTGGGGEGSDGGGGDGGGSGSTTGCPDEVPEEYQYIWDCQAETCDGPMLYRYGVGSSDASGELTIVEQWFLFNGGSDYCVDAFTVQGEWSVIDPTTFNCSQCERTFEVEWDHTTQSCGVIWGGIFFGEDGQSEEPPYDGFLMFDTHTAFGGRNEGNGALVVGAPVLGGAYYPKPDWARGTANPQGEDPEDPAEYTPEDYVYVNSGSCLGMTGTSGVRTVDATEDTPEQVATPLAP